MFDQQPPQPDDMFAGTEPAKPEASNQRPSNSVMPGRPVSLPSQPMPGESPAPSPIFKEMLGDEEPRLGGGNNKVFLAVIAAVVVLVLGAGGYFAWRQLTNPSAQVLEGGPSINTVPPVAAPEESIAPEIEEPIDVLSGVEVLPEDEGIIEVDTDMDGIIDDEELNLGTNPMKVDSDDDGLTDREEIKIYNTDPLNPDTDGDTYLDGEEVKAGYNPNGAGKLFELPVDSGSSEVVE